jgi:hypothetical protein
VVGQGLEPPVVETVCPQAAEAKQDLLGDS